MMKFTAPAGYVRTKPPARPKLDPFIPVIDRILFDGKSRPRKQHTAKRIFERLRDEYGFTGGPTIVKDYVAGWRQRAQGIALALRQAIRRGGPLRPRRLDHQMGRPLPKACWMGRRNDRGDPHFLQASALAP
jgi:hypothetical protein